MCMKNGYALSHAHTQYFNDIIIILMLSAVLKMFFYVVTSNLADV